LSERYEIRIFKYAVYTRNSPESTIGKQLGRKDYNW